MPLVEIGVRTALTKAGANLTKVYGPALGLMQQELEKAPAFIREAAEMTIKEKFDLLHPTVDAMDVDLLAAKQQTVEHFRHRRQSGGDGDEGYQQESNDTVCTVFERCLRALLDKRKATAEAQLLSDPEQMVAVVVKALSRSPAFQDSRVGGRPTTDVLDERVRQLQEPELRVLVSLVTGKSAEAAGQRWLAAMNSEA